AKDFTPSTTRNKKIRSYTQIRKLIIRRQGNQKAGERLVQSKNIMETIYFGIPSSYPRGFLKKR
ncbi:MAG: hypothetical protein QXS27_06100, partial [Candidatus Jordarchaeaceae archaeon]